jgi:hypothetical protein
MRTWRRTSLRSGERSAVTLIVPGGAIDTGTKTFIRIAWPQAALLIDPGYAEVHFNLAPALAG